MLILRDPHKLLVPLGDTESQFKHSDTEAARLGQPSGISCEEGEFLYGLVRIMRPTKVLETGCNIGVSASYILQGLEDNGHGHLRTIEHDKTVSSFAQAKLDSMGFKRFDIFTGEIADFPQPENNSIDLLWLDSELDQRYAELVRFYPCMKVGAIACIHDHPRFGTEGFGEMPELLTQLIVFEKLSIMTFPTSHGVCVFQKRA